MEFNLEEIKNLLDAFEERNMHKFQLKRGDFELVLERASAKSEVIANAPLMEQLAVRQPIAHQLPPHFPGHEKHHSEVLVEDAHAKYIDSPMVGTFYSAPAPGESTFVNIGDKVKKGDVVCIIEAMKVMNEVKATADGVIKEVLVEDGHPVEFGTKIFKIG